MLTEEDIHNQIRQESLNQYNEEVKKQNKSYFSTKIRDLLEREKMGNDIVASIKAKFIFKNLNINPKDYIDNYDQVSEHFKISENENKKEKKEQSEGKEVEEAPALENALVGDNLVVPEMLGKRPREPEEVAESQNGNEFKMLPTNIKRQRVQANKNPTALAGVTSQLSFGNQQNDLKENSVTSEAEYATGYV